MNEIIARYKFPLLISFVVSLAMIALRGEAYWLNIILLLVGSFVGIFLLDLELIINSYIVDAGDEKSQQVREVVRSKNFKKFVEYLNNSEYNHKELPLSSVVFQIMLLMFCFYVLLVSGNVFVHATVFTAFAVMLYRQVIEIARIGDLDRWFWIYNGNLDKRTSYFYIGAMVLIFAFAFRFV